MTSGCTSRLSARSVSLTAAATRDVMTYTHRFERTCAGITALWDYLKDEIKKSPVRMAGAFLSQNAYKAMNKQLNPEQFGGAPLLGLHGNLLKAHGSSNATSIMNAIRQASEIIKQDMYHQSALDIEKANAVCTAPESASSSGQGLE